MIKTGITKKEVLEIIDEEWRESEGLLSTFAMSMGTSLRLLKKQKILLKPSMELVVWNCNSLCRDEINRADEEGILNGISARIAGKVLERIYKEAV